LEQENLTPDIYIRALKKVNEEKTMPPSPRQLLGAEFLLEHILEFILQLFIPLRRNFRVRITEQEVIRHRLVIGVEQGTRNERGHGAHQGNRREHFPLRGIPRAVSMAPPAAFFSF
jgi:hypothetical protein